MIRTSLAAWVGRGDLLRDQPRYGFDLVRALAQSDGLVATAWHESPSGPPRRYGGGAGVAVRLRGHAKATPATG